jgi:hypothetical protein
VLACKGGETLKGYWLKSKKQKIINVKSKIISL